MNKIDYYKQEAKKEFKLIKKQLKKDRKDGKPQCAILTKKYFELETLCLTEVLNKDITNVHKLVKQRVSELEDDDKIKLLLEYERNKIIELNKCLEDMLHYYKSNPKILLIF